MQLCFIVVIFFFISLSLCLAIGMDMLSDSLPITNTCFSMFVGIWNVLIGWDKVNVLSSIVSSRHLWCKISRKGIKDFIANLARLCPTSVIVKAFMNAIVAQIFFSCSQLDYFMEIYSQFGMNFIYLIYFIFNKKLWADNDDMRLTG